MRLYATGDVARELHVSRTRIYELWQYGQLPPPLGITSAGAIWRAGDIDEYARTRNRRPGRPKVRRDAKA